MSPEHGADWRRLHPVTIIREFLGVAWNIVIAVIVFGALREGGLFGGIEILIPLAFLGLAVGRYVSTRYAVTPEAVLWRRGILFRQRVEVPRSRIQNVSSGADVLGRIFGLRTVTISTAGSEGELQLALVTTDESSFLLGELLGRRAPAPAPDVEASWPGEHGVGTDAPPGVAPPPPSGPWDPSAPGPWDPPLPAGPPPPTGPARPDLPPPLVRPPVPPAAGYPAGPLPPPPPGRVLVSLSSGQLLRFALTGIGAGTVIVTGVAVALVATTGSVQPLFLLVFVLGGRILSAAELNDFQLTAEADRIRVRHGLLRTHDKWARRERIQVFAVDRPVLRAALGHETVSVATADATVGGDTELSLCSPLADRSTWPDLAAALLEPTALTEAGLRPISPVARRRRTIRWTLALWVPATIVLVGGVVGERPVVTALGAVALVAAVVVAWLLAGRAQRIDGWTLDDEHLLVRRGILASRLWLVRRHKVQSVVLTATPFQRRLGLASVLVDTANVTGGAVLVPDLPRAQAEELAAELVELADRVFLPDGV